MKIHLHPGRFSQMNRRCMSKVGQMSRQIGVRWNMEWNGILQAYYIRYSTNDIVFDKDRSITNIPLMDINISIY
jgi:hypothetical protein